jgi:hypothetical protein
MAISHHISKFRKKWHWKGEMMSQTGLKQSIMRSQRGFKQRIFGRFSINSIKEQKFSINQINRFCNRFLIVT